MTVEPGASENGIPSWICTFCSSSLETVPCGVKAPFFHFCSKSVICSQQLSSVTLGEYLPTCFAYHSVHFLQNIYHNTCFTCSFYSNFLCFLFNPHFYCMSNSISIKAVLCKNMHHEPYTQYALDYLLLI